MNWLAKIIRTWQRRMQSWADYYDARSIVAAGPDYKNMYNQARRLADERVNRLENKDGALRPKYTQACIQLMVRNARAAVKPHTRHGRVISFNIFVGNY